MGKKLFVGNLAFSVNDAALQEAFSSVGTVVSAKVIIDRDTGKSKGFGFVEMSSDAEAEESIKRLNSSDLSGRAISVSEARPQAPRENRGGGGGGFGGGGNRGGYGGGGGFGGGDRKRSFGRGGY